MDGVAATTRPIRIAFYAAANLNLIDGSAIWVQSVAETLHVDDRIHITLPLKVAERREVVTGLLRRLDRVRLVPPAIARQGGSAAMTHQEALDMIERLDVEEPFDILLLRGYDLCLAAAQRPRLRGRLWSCYILEPEKDAASAEYVTGMMAIATASRHVVVQSEEMRALFEALVPSAIGRTILLPPAIPPTTVKRPDPGRIVRRMIYTGKFHRFYPVPDMVRFFGDLRATWPDLEFHVAGDKIYRTTGDDSYARDLERMLSSTDGLVWHGGIARDAVERLLAAGGVALSLWDHRYGSDMNDLVISTKLLDYCSVGLPVILNRTMAQETMLGPDYPLFVERPADAQSLLRRVFDDADLYREASDRTFAATRRFTYPVVYDRLRPWINSAVAFGSPTAARTEQSPGDPPDPTIGPAVEVDVDRPKLTGASRNIGVDLGPAAGIPAAGAPAGGGREVAGAYGLGPSLDLIERLRASDDRFRLVVRTPRLADGASTREPVVRELRAELDSAGRTALANAVTVVDAADDRPSWLRTVGFLVRPDASGSADVIATATASGTLLVELRDDPTDPPPSADGSPGSSAVPIPVDHLAGGPAAVAAAIVGLIHSGRWLAESERCRRAGRAALTTVPSSDENNGAGSPAEGA